MINLKSLKKGDKFYHCCEFHWKVKYEFIQVLKDGRIKVKYLQNSGINSRGEIEYLTESDLKYCFSDNQSAGEYQKKCKSRVRDKSKDELLKEIFDKASAAGIFTSEEYKLYRSVIYK